MKGWCFAQMGFFVLRCEQPPTLLLTERTSKKLYSDRVQAPLTLCNSRRSEWEIIVHLVFRHLALIAALGSKKPPLASQKVSTLKCSSSFKRISFPGFQEHLTKFVKRKKEKSVAREQWAGINAFFLPWWYQVVLLVRWRMANQWSWEGCGADRCMMGNLQRGFVHVYRSFLSIHTNKQNQYDNTNTMPVGGTNSFFTSKV